MQIYQVKVFTKDGSSFDFGAHSSKATADFLAETINESKYLASEDKALVITLNVSDLNLSAVASNKPKSKKKNTTRKALGSTTISEVLQ